MSRRIDKINELIRQRVAEIISRRLSLKPGVFVTVTGVDTSPDIRYTRLSVSVLPENQSRYAIKTLENESFAIQKELNSALKTKFRPQLSFHLDKTHPQADKIDAVLKKIKEENEVA